jgi:hypothetical protein
MVWMMPAFDSAAIVRYNFTLGVVVSKPVRTYAYADHTGSSMISFYKTRCEQGLSDRSVAFSHD